jgi:hypothetical protein
MFCENCGTKIEDGATFCHNCGRKTDAFLTTPTHTSTKTQQKLENGDIFYSKEWHQKVVFAISATSRLDILVDDQYLYLIRLPKYNNSTLGLILGLIIGNIIGAYIGQSIGESSDETKRQSYRSTWVNADGKLISREYERDIFQKIPLSSLGGNVIFKKSRVTLTYDEKRFVLDRRVRSFRRPDSTEADRLHKYIEKYVL